MPSYKKLKSVSHNLGANFTSTLAWVDHNYFMGHLLMQVRNTGFNKLSADLLTKKIQPSELANEAITKYVGAVSEDMKRLVEQEGSSIEFISDVILSITVDLSQKRKNNINGTEYEECPYTCEVTITDNRGITYTSTLSEWWILEG